MSEKFRQRMDTLRSELEKCAGSIEKSCTSVLLIVACLVPFVVLGVLYWRKPLCVSQNFSGLGQKRKLDLVKTAGLTLGVSVAVWGLLYLLSMWEPFQSGLLCLIR